MSDLRAFNIKSKTVLKNKGYDLKAIKELINSNSQALLGLTIIANDLDLQNKHDEVEILAYDESYKLVLVEYRKDKYGSVIKKALMASDYIRHNISKFKVLLSEIVSKNIIDNLNFNPRIIVIGEDFSEYDAYGVKQTPYEIDLIKAKVYNEFIILEKVYESYKECIVNKVLITNPYFKELHEFIMSLADEVNATGNNSYICYRKIKNFCYIINNNDKLICNVRSDKNSSLEINTKKDLEKAFKIITKAYDEN